VCEIDAKMWNGRLSGECRVGVGLRYKRAEALESS
jgi:hypothetical protein